METFHDFWQKVQRSVDALIRIWAPGWYFKREDDDWYTEPLSRGRILEGYLRKHTANPYIANLLTTIWVSGNTISVEEAIERVEQKKQKGAIELMAHVDSADVWGGGGSRCFYEGGVYDALQILEANTNIHTSTSGGVIPASFRAMHTQGESYGIDTSPPSVEKFAMGLVESLRLRGLYEKPNGLAGRVRKGWAQTTTLTRGYLKEGFVDIEDARRFVTSEFRVKKNGSANGKALDDLTCGDLRGFYAVTADIGTNGNNRTVLSCSETPNETLWSAFMKTMALPYLFDPVRENGSVFGDGGLQEPVPLAVAFNEAGADFAVSVIVNYRIPRYASNFRRMQGKIRQGDRNFDLMNRAITYWIVKYLTGDSPGDVARYGDRFGRNLMLIPDLSKVDYLDFFEEGPAQFQPGRRDALDAFEIFMSPRFVHPRYDPEHFLQRMKTVHRPYNEENKVRLGLYTPPAKVRKI